MEKVKNELCCVDFFYLMRKRIKNLIKNEQLFKIKESCNEENRELIYDRKWKNSLYILLSNVLNYFIKSIGYIWNQHITNTYTLNEVRTECIHMKSCNILQVCQLFQCPSPIIRSIEYDDWATEIYFSRSTDTGLYPLRSTETDIFFNIQAKNFQSSITSDRYQVLC